MMFSLFRLVLFVLLENLLLFVNDGHDRRELVGTELNVLFAEQIHQLQNTHTHIYIQYTLTLGRDIDGDASVCKNMQKNRPGINKSIVFLWSASYKTWTEPFNE